MRAVYLGCVFVAIGLMLWTCSARGETGVASVYTIASNHGRQIACRGPKLDHLYSTAAHKTLPCGTNVKVTNLRNGKSTVVTITDRGPYIRGRIIDLTPRPAAAIGCDGLCRVTVTRL